MHAKRVLKERGAEQVVPALAAWVKALKPDDPESEHLRLEALWVYQALNVVEPALLGDAARIARRPRPRGGGPRRRVLEGRLPDALALLAPRVEDEHPGSGWKRSASWPRFPTQESAEHRAAGARQAGGHVPRLRLVADGPRARAGLAPRACRRGRSTSTAIPGGWSSRFRPRDRPRCSKPLLSLYRAGRVPDEQDAAAAQPDRGASAVPTSWRWSSTWSERRDVVAQQSPRDVAERPGSRAAATARSIPSGDLSAARRAVRRVRRRALRGRGLGRRRLEDRGARPRAGRAGEGRRRRAGRSGDRPSGRCWGSAIRVGPRGRDAGRDPSDPNGVKPMALAALAGSQPASGRGRRVAAWLAGLKLDDASQARRSSPVPRTQGRPGRAREGRAPRRSSSPTSPSSASATCRPSGRLGARADRGARQGRRTRRDDARLFDRREGGDPRRDQPAATPPEARPSSDAPS